jgi:galactonate dehydratase
MKIKRVEAFALRFEPRGRPEGAADVQGYGDYFIHRGEWTSIYSNRLETTIVRLEADDGTVGWGEAQSPVSPRTTRTIVEDLLRPILIGADPFDVEALWQRGYGAMRERGHPTGFYVDALGGVDVALLDIVGKATGKPVHKLIGGRFRDRVPVYVGLGGTDPGQVAAQARDHVALGYRALKLHLRGPSARIVAIVAAVRGAVGADIQLMVDVHTTFDVPGAITLGRRLEEHEVAWLESPTAPEDVKGQAEIARALDMAVCVGEWSRTRFEMREAFERRAGDVYNFDIGRTGLTEGKKIAALADTYNIRVTPHIGAGGILSIAASIQFSAAIPNFLIMEHSHGPHGEKKKIASYAPDPVDGAFVVDDRPGVGVDVDEAAVRKYAVD